MFSCSDSNKESQSTTETQPKIENEKNPTSKYDFVIGKACSFDKSYINKKVYSFDSDIDADNALKRIMKLTGLPANFEIRAASVDNACAVIKCDDEGNCNRYILYNQEFMEKVKDQTKTNFSELAILAHEIAHHLSGHTLENSGNSYDMELESDKFAGYILFKLGASIEETKKTYSTLSGAGSTTHPPRAARIAALKNGWYDAKRNGEQVVSIKEGTKEEKVNVSNSKPKVVSKKTKEKKREMFRAPHGTQYSPCSYLASTNPYNSQPTPVIGEFIFYEGDKTATCLRCGKDYHIHWKAYEISGSEPYEIWGETDESKVKNKDGIYGY